MSSLGATLDTTTTSTTTNTTTSVRHIDRQRLAPHSHGPSSFSFVQNKILYLALWPFLHPPAMPQRGRLYRREFRKYYSVVLLECLRKYVSKNLLAFRIKKYVAFPPGFWCVCARGKKILQATPSKLRREMGMCATTIYVRQQQQVLYDTSTRCTYSSLEPLVPGAAYLVYQAGSTCSRAR